MIQVGSIETPLKKIRCFQNDEGRLKVAQPDTVLAMGYPQPYLSRNKKRGSGFGKFLHGDVITKHKNLTLLDLKLLVENILPQFLKDFLRTIRGQPSRQQFFGKDPMKIYHNTERLLQILKGRLYMIYNPNSLEAKKGALGEAIVKKILERFGWIVEKPADTFKSGASIVDFYCRSFDGTVGDFTEVKTQIAYPYGIEKAPCYSFPTKRIEAYKEYSRTHGALKIFVVDPEAGEVFGQKLDILENPTLIDGKEYPFNKHVEIMGGDFHYWHRNQFELFALIDEDDLAELRKLFNINAPEKKEDTATAEPPVNEPETQPVGKTTTDTLAPDISVKTLIERTAAKVGLTTEILLTAILDCRQKCFDEMQAKLKAKVLCE